MKKHQAEADALVADLIAFHAGLKPALVQLKYRKMVLDAFSFFRGTDRVFARAWPKLKPTRPGPRLLICGDLHLENFGAYRSDDGGILFDINDFDEALRAPCAFDLVRFTTSVFLAAETWSLSPIAATGIAIAFLDHYRAAIVKARKTGRAGEVALEHGKPHGPIAHMLGDLASGDPVKVLERVTHKHGSGGRKIKVCADRFPALDERRAGKVRAAVESLGKAAGKAHAGAYRVLDVSGRIAGVGSLGTRRYVALVEGDGSPDGNWLLDIKEERHSAASAWNGRGKAPPARNYARRVVAAQRALQAKPVANLAALKIGRLFYRVRRFVPDEHRANLDRLQKDPVKLRAAVGEAGRLAAWSQVRGARRAGRKTLQALFDWADSAALDGVLGSAARYADLTQRDFQHYCEAFCAGRFETPAVSND